MQINMAKVAGLVLTCAITAFALPSNSYGVPEVSPRRDFGPQAALLGISCNGNSECGDYCQVNIMKIKSLVDTIDDDKTFSNFEQIACHSCWTGPPPSDSPKHGICIFARDLKPGKTVTAKLVKGKLNALIRFGCGICGSNPTEPSSNPKDGQIKVDFTRDFCGTGVCNKTATASHESLTARELSASQNGDVCRANTLRCQDNTVQECDVQGHWYDHQVCRTDQTCKSNCDNRGKCDPYCRTDYQAPISPRDDDVHTMLNINCHGSGWCTSACGRNIWQVKAFVDTIADSKEFSNKQRLACVKCDGKDGGFCAFPQSMGKNERVTTKTAKEMIDKLIKKGCSRCGSAPLKGNDVKYGQLTVNYVAKVCKHGVC